VLKTRWAANGGNATRAAYGRVHDAEAVGTLRLSDASRLSAPLADDAEH